VPYRDEELGELCHQCERPAQQACPCCSRFTCPRHLDESKQMCGKCDEAYYRYMHREDAQGAFVHVLVLVAVASVPPIISMSLLPLTLGAVFLGFPTILWYRNARDRRRFFAEMRTRGQIAAPPTHVSREAEELAKWDARALERHYQVFEASYDSGDAPEPPKE
jgi:hypothetical protein